jgi:hypothetical protein
MITILIACQRPAGGGGPGSRLWTAKSTAIVIVMNTIILTSGFQLPTAGPCSRRAGRLMKGGAVHLDGWVVQLTSGPSRGRAGHLWRAGCPTGRVGPFRSTESPSGSTERPSGWTDGPSCWTSRPSNWTGRPSSPSHPTPNLYSYPSLLTACPTLRRRPAGRHQPSIKHLDGQVDGSGEHAIDLDYDELT